MSNSIKPQLADDADLDSVTFPCILQPKIDGVRGVNLDGRLTGRSLDEFKAPGVTDRFSSETHWGLDGELTLGDSPVSERLCSLTTGALGKFKGVTGMPDIHWWVFDLVRPNTIELPYEARLELVRTKVEIMADRRVRVVDSYVIEDRATLDMMIGKMFDEGYEGVIIRNPKAKYKAGRPTKKGWELMRVKPWGDAEILVTGITEGTTNTNEAKTNTLGRTERSTAKEGLVPNGQVGSIQGTLLADVKCPFTGKHLFDKGLAITVSPGQMTIKEAEHYFQNPDEIVGHIVKFQHMTYGTKDLPRFPGYLSHRLPQDMS